MTQKLVFDRTIVIDERAVSREERDRQNVCPVVAEVLAPDVIQLISDDEGRYDQSCRDAELKDDQSLP